jgi:hypothetical protein
MNVGQLKDFLEAYETDLRMDAELVVELDLPGGSSVPCSVAGLTVQGNRLVLEVVQPKT